jgi:WD40 repeat protein
VYVLLEGHNNPIVDLLFIDKSQLLLSLSFDCIIKIWNANDNYNCINTIDSFGLWFGKFLFLKNGYFAAYFEDNKIGIWELVNFNCINIFKHDFVLSDIISLKDNRILAQSSDGKILIWSY